MPAPKYARPEWDDMKFITTIICMPTTRFSIVPTTGQNFLLVRRHFCPYLKIWAMVIPLLRDGYIPGDRCRDKACLVPNKKRDAGASLFAIFQIKLGGFTFARKDQSFGIGRDNNFVTWYKMTGNHFFGQLINQFFLQQAL